MKNPKVGKVKTGKQITYHAFYRNTQFYNGKMAKNKPKSKMGTFGKSDHFWTKKMALRVAKSIDFGNISILLIFGLILVTFPL